MEPCYVIFRYAMFKSVIFDFNGVLADDEPAHMEAFQFVARQEGVVLTDAQYFERYLSFSDWELFRTLFDDRKSPIDPTAVDALVARKVRRYYEILAERCRRTGSALYSGAATAIRAAAETGPVAIASGARREEIDFILGAAGLRNLFAVIVAAEDVERSKPDPEPFRRAARLLDARIGGDSPGAYLAVEDSPGGVRSAKAAGLACLALEQSYSQVRLGEADWVIPSIGDFADWLVERVST